MASNRRHSFTWIKPKKSIYSNGVSFKNQLKAEKHKKSQFSQKSKCPMHKDAFKTDFKFKCAQYYFVNVSLQLWH